MAPRVLAEVAPRRLEDGAVNDRELLRRVKESVARAYAFYGPDVKITVSDYDTLTVAELDRLVTLAEQAEALYEAAEPFTHISGGWWNPKRLVEACAAYRVAQESEGRES